MPVVRPRAGRIDISRSSSSAAAARVLVLFAGLAAAGVARGEDAKAAVPERVVTGDPVDVEATRPRGSERAPAAETTVVDAARYAGQVRSVAELLGAAPGVTLRALGGPGQPTTASLRGAAADQSLVLLDGIPLVGPAGGAVDLATIPAGLLERIVVTRGVLGAQLGSGALGGVIELEPRSPRDPSLRAGAQASFGSFGTAQLAADAGAGSAAGNAWVAAVQLDRTGGAFGYQRKLTPELGDAPFYDDTRANADSRRAAALLRGTALVAPSVRATALAMASAGERGLPGPVGGFTPHARAKDASWVAGAQAQALSGGAVWGLRGWGRGSWLELRGVQPFGDCVDGAPGCVPSASRAHAARGEADVRYAAGEQVLTVLAGAGAETASGSGVAARARAVGTAAIADAIRLAGGRINVHPALRVDAVGEHVGWSPAIAAAAAPFAEGSALGPLEVRAGWGRSFRAPTFPELFLDQGAITPNPDLRPERAWSLDAGLGWRGERVALSLGAFWSRYADLILYEQNPPSRIKPFNVGAARIAGVEARAVATLPYAVTVEASYAFLDAVNERASATQAGQKLAYRPPHRLFLRASHRGDRFEGYAEADAVSPMPRNQFGTASLPGRVLLNAGAGVRAAGPLWLDVECKNLLDDRRQQDLFQYPLPGLSLAVVARARL